VQKLKKPFIEVISPALTGKSMAINSSAPIMSSCLTLGCKDHFVSRVTKKTVLLFFVVFLLPSFSVLIWEFSCDLKRKGFSPCPCLLNHEYGDFSILMRVISLSQKCAWGADAIMETAYLLGYASEEAAFVYQLIERDVTSRNLDQCKSCRIILTAGSESHELLIRWPRAVVLFGFLIIMQASCFSCSTFFQWNILQDA
jgi:hypothetical protein